jgi:hypothetical protein
MIIFTGLQKSIFSSMHDAIVALQAFDFFLRATGPEKLRFT